MASYAVLPFLCRSNYDWFNEQYKNVFNSEGTKYEWFNNHSLNNFFWSRSPNPNSEDVFLRYYRGILGRDYSHSTHPVCPAFVIG